MIHLFEALGRKMALDVGSGAVMSLDDIAYDALYLLLEDRNADIAARLAEKYPREEAEETVSELRQLIAEGYLDTPDDYSDVKPVDSGVVKAMCLHAAHDCNRAASTALRTRASTTCTAAACSAPRRAKRRWTGWWRTAASAKIWRWTSSAASR